MEIINYYADVCARDSDSDIEIREEEEDRDFADNNTEIENNRSDYYGLTNVARSISDAENDAFSETDLEAFKIERG